MFYDMLIKIYKKENNQVFKSKDKHWRQKHDYKNLKDLNYQPNEIQPDQPQQPDQSILPTWVKATKSRFNEMQSIITEAKKSGLVTITNIKRITLSDAEKLFEGIISEKINKNEATKMYNDIIDGANAINRLNPTKNRMKMINIFKQLEEIFIIARKTIFLKSWNTMECLKRPSRYNLFINFLAENNTVFLITEKLKTRTLQ